MRGDWDIWMLSCIYIYVTAELYIVTAELYTFKPVLSGHSRTDKINDLKTDGGLMQVKSITECILQYF